MKVNWDDLPRDQWAQLHAREWGSLQQSWAYGEAMASLEVKVLRAMVWQGDQLVAIAQFICKRIAGYISFASCSRGPVWHPDLQPQQRAEVYKLLRQSMPLPRLRVVLFSPDREESQVDAAEIKGLYKVMTGYSTVMLDLRPPLDSLKAGFEGKWRNRLNKALANEKIRVQVQASVKRCEWLLGQELDQREAKKFHGLPTAFVSAYIGASAEPRLAFLVAYAEYGKDTVAAMLFLIHGAVASYHMGWSNEQGRQLNAHNLLMWKLMAQAQSMGLEGLDLGGVNTHDLPGISRFKLGTGGRVLRLAGTFF